MSAGAAVATAARVRWVVCLFVLAYFVAFVAMPVVALYGRLASAVSK